jgi:hypothetical protein
VLLALLFLLSSSMVTAAARHPARNLLQQDAITADIVISTVQPSSEAVTAAIAAVLPAAEGIDQTCLLQNCGMAAIACISDTECKAATDVLQACR